MFRQVLVEEKTGGVVFKDAEQLKLTLLRLLLAQHPWALRTETIRSSKEDEPSFVFSNTIHDEWLVGVMANLEESLACNAAVGIWPFPRPGSTECLSVAPVPDGIIARLPFDNGKRDRLSEVTGKTSLRSIEVEFMFGRRRYDQVWEVDCNRIARIIAGHELAQAVLTGEEIAEQVAANEVCRLFDGDLVVEMRITHITLYPMTASDGVVRCRSHYRDNGWRGNSSGTINESPVIHFTISGPEDPSSPGIFLPVIDAPTMRRMRALASTLAERFADA